MCGGVRYVFRSLRCMYIFSGSNKIVTQCLFISGFSCKLTRYTRALTWGWTLVLTHAVCLKWRHKSVVDHDPNVSAVFTHRPLVTKRWVIIFFTREDNFHLSNYKTLHNICKFFLKFILLFQINSKTTEGTVSWNCICQINRARFCFYQRRLDLNSCAAHSVNTHVAFWCWIRIGIHELFSWVS